MSRIVAGLARSRLIEVSNDPHDARRLRIRATPKGSHLLRHARKRRIADLAAQLQGLAPGELERLGDAVEILKDMLQNWY